ncbi:MAG: hypothetical protein ACOVMM_03670 [Chitinophagaceae bacterium]
MKKIVLLLAIIAKSTFSFTQGCSDAGFCTLGNLNPLHQNKEKSQLTIGFTNGIGDEGVFVFTPSIKYDYRINKSWEIQAKVTSNYASGNLGSAFGLGDLFLNTTHTFKSKSKWKSSFIIGTKIPLNNSNLKFDNKSLPMQYQSSLGTVDAIAGYTITNSKWLFATAVQIPLTHHNGNQFLPLVFGGSNASKYPPTFNFNRKADVLIRGNYEIASTAKSKFNIGLLGIYHLSNDFYKNLSISNNYIEINGSEGLTLNFTAAASFKLSKKFTLGFLAGTPLVVRDLRPDGLTRSFSINTDLIFNF